MSFDLGHKKRKAINNGPHARSFAYRLLDLILLLCVRARGPRQIEHALLSTGDGPKRWVTMTNPSCFKMKYTPAYGPKVARNDVRCKTSSR